MQNRPAPSSSQSCLACTRRHDRPFCDLRADSLSELNIIAHPAHYSHGVTIFREGDKGECLYILCAGRVKLSVTSREGRTMILRIAQPGDVLGLGAALSAAAHEVTAEAMDLCEFKVVSRRDFMRLLERSPEVSLHAAQCAAYDYKSAFEEACRFGLPSSSAGRLARLFLDWSQTRKREGQQADTFPLSLTHEELAGLTATSRETVSRTLAQFKRDKLISLKGVSLTILQPRSLEQLSA